MVMDLVVGCFPFSMQEVNVILEAYEKLCDFATESFPTVDDILSQYQLEIDIRRQDLHYRLMPNDFYDGDPHREMCYPDMMRDDVDNHLGIRTTLSKDNLRDILNHYGICYSDRDRGEIVNCPVVEVW